MKEKNMIRSIISGLLRAALFISLAGILMLSGCKKKEVRLRDKEDMAQKFREKEEQNDRSSDRQEEESEKNEKDDRADDKKNSREENLKKMLSYLDGKWEIMDDAQLIQEPGIERDTITFHSEEGKGEFLRSNGSKAKFDFELSDMFSSAEYQYDLLTIDAYGTKEVMEWADTGNEGLSLGISLANNLGMDYMILTETGDERTAFATDALQYSRSMLGCWFLRRADGEDAKLDDTVGNEDSIRIRDDSFYALKWAEFGNSCTLQEVEVVNDMYKMLDDEYEALSYRIPESDHATSAVNYEWKGMENNPHDGYFSLALVKVKTDRDGKIVDMTAYERYLGGCYYKTDDGENNRSSDKSSKMVRNSNVYCFEINDLKMADADIDVDGDGKRESLNFKIVSDVWKNIESIVVFIDDRKTVIDKGLDGYAPDGLKCVWFNTDKGDRYLYLQWDLDNGYTGTSIYRYEDYGFYYIDQSGTIVDYEYDPDSDDWKETWPKDPDRFNVGHYEQKLGTLWISRACRIGEDGLPEQIDKFGYYAHTVDPFIRAKEDIPAMIVDDAGNDVHRSEIGKGCYIIPYRTDEETFIDVYVVENGRKSTDIRRLYIEEASNPYGWKISGEWGLKSNYLTDLFEGLNFAG